MRAGEAARLRLYRELLGAFSARAAAVCLIQEASDMVGKSLFSLCGKHFGGACSAISAGFADNGSFLKKPRRKNQKKHHESRVCVIGAVSLAVAA
ncbi:MAG: hypothetical protein ACKON9_13495 [Planctomycetaceae bacterium]